MNTKRLTLSALIGLLIIAALIAANDYVFRTWLNADYVRWYLRNGALINLGFAFVSLAWGDLNRVKDLVGAHPFRFIAASLFLVALPIQTFGTILRRPSRAAHAARRAAFVACRSGARCGEARKRSWTRSTDC